MCAPNLLHCPRSLASSTVTLERPGDISFGKSSKLPRNRRAAQNSPSSSTGAQAMGKLSTIELLNSPGHLPHPCYRWHFPWCAEPEAFLSQNTLACSRFLGGLGAPPASLRGSLLRGRAAWSQRKLRRRRSCFANPGWRKRWSAWFLEQSESLSGSAGG